MTYVDYNTITLISFIAPQILCALPTHPSCPHVYFLKEILCRTSKINTSEAALIRVPGDPESSPQPSPVVPELLPSVWGI